MTARLIFEFPDEDLRDCFLADFSDGGLGYQAAEGLEEALEEAANDNDLDVGPLYVKIDYKRAFESWGWDGQGDPVVVVEVKHRIEDIRDLT